MAAKALTRKSATKSKAKRGISSSTEPEDVLEMNMVRELASHFLCNDEALPRFSSGKSVDGFLRRLASRVIPNSKAETIKQAFRYYEDDDFLGSLIDMIRDFCNAGFYLQPAMSAGQMDSDQLLVRQKAIDKFMIDFDVCQVIDSLVVDRQVCDNFILYWKVGDQVGRASKSTTNLFPKLIEFNALDPREVDWDNSGGKDDLYVNIPDKLIKEVNLKIDALKKAKKTPVEIVQLLREDGYGLAWIIAIMNKQTQAKLTNEDGDYWIVSSAARKYHGLAKPTMRRIFPKLKIRQFFQEGEMGAAFLFSAFLCLIKQGESITTGNSAGSTKNWLKVEDAKALMKKFAAATGAARLAMNHTTTVEWVYPPADMFSEERLDVPNKGIVAWSGFPYSIFMGGGDNYSEGYLGLRKATARMMKIRNQISDTLVEFFRHPSITGQSRMMKDMVIQPCFNSNILKEPRQLLDEIKFLFEHEIGNARQAAQELDRNPETLISSKMQARAEQKSAKAWTGVGNQGKKVSSGNPEGRPSKDGSSTDEFSRQQPPSPRPTENSSTRRIKKKPARRAALART